MNVTISHEVLRWLYILFQPVDEVSPVLDIVLHPCLKVIILVGHLEDPINDNLHPLVVILVFNDNLSEEDIQPHICLLSIWLRMCSNFDHMLEKDKEWP